LFSPFCISWIFAQTNEDVDEGDEEDVDEGDEDGKQKPAGVILRSVGHDLIHGNHVRLRARPREGLSRQRPRPVAETWRSQYQVTKLHAGPSNRRAQVQIFAYLGDS